MKPPLWAQAARPWLIGLILWTGGISQSFAAEATRSQNGLFPDEIISADDLYRLLKEKKDLLVFDARDERSFETSHLPGARLPLSQEYYREVDLFKNGIISKAPDYEAALKTAVGALPAHASIVTYCNRDCHASAVLALRLKQQGVRDVRAMVDGIQTWTEKGYPVESLKDPRASE